MIRECEDKFVAGDTIGGVRVVRRAKERDINGPNGIEEMYEVEADKMIINTVDSPTWYAPASHLKPGYDYSKDLAEDLAACETKFGNLTVTSIGSGDYVFVRGKRKGLKVKRACVLCDCDCGTKNINVWVYHLVHGNKRSCGCLGYNRRKASCTSHDNCHHRLYWVYRAMIDRCYNPNNKYYSRYGGRGIRVCLRWYDPNKTPKQRKREGNIEFQNFLEDAYANGFYDQPKDTPIKDILSIDRIDNDGDYEPDNVRWVDRKAQQNNRSVNCEIIDGDRLYTSRSSFEDEYNLDQGFVRRKIDKGWPMHAILYAAHHDADFKIHKTRKDQHDGALYRDQDGFMRMMPKPGNPLYDKNEDH